MNTTLIDNRQIRVFISSTFQDMQDERNYLMKHTFPKLKSLAEKRDVTLTELDLRWGITPEEAETGKVVEICLREIENSIPFFVGIIGNRYGWVPKQEDIGKNVTDRFAKVNDYLMRHLSVTEMEMQFAVLDREEDMHAYFYIKQEENEQDNPEMLNRLKEKVRESKYPNSTYDSSENLGQQVEKAFTELLDKLFPEDHLSESEKEARLQCSFRNSLCRNYIRDDQNFRAIDDWLEKNESPQLVITGASGLGKSALIANWLKVQETKKEQPYHIVYHFVGNGGNEGSHGQICAFLAGEIRAAYGFSKEKQESTENKDELENAFAKVASEGDKPLLVVLDAVNQVADIDNAKQLNWLPIPPKNVRILFSTLENDKTMDVFKNRHYPIFTLQPLDINRRRDLVKTYLGDFGKKLEDKQVERIITDTQCENTLVLKTLLDELINFGIFEKLDERIEYFLHPDSIEDFYQALLESYESEFPFTRHVLSLLALSRSGLSEDELLQAANITQLHWSQFYCSFRSHLTTKGGLITFGHSYVRNAVETRYSLLDKNEETDAIREKIIAVFVGQNNHRALHELPHQYYELQDDERLHDVLMDMEAFLFLKKTDEHALIHYWNKLKEKYSLEEYVPLAEQSENKAKSFANLAVFCRESVVVPELSLKFATRSLDYVENDEDRAKTLNQISLSNSLLGRHKNALEYQLMALKIKQSLFGEFNPDVAAFYNNAGSFYDDLGDYHKALEYKLKALEIRSSLLGDNHPDTAASFSSAGVTYGNLGDNKKALEFHLKSLGIRQSIFGNNHEETARSFNNVGTAYDELGDYQKALEYKNMALNTSKIVYGEEHPNTATYYNNIGSSYSEIGDHPKALEYKQKALEIRQKVFGEEHPITATSINNVGVEYLKLGNYKKALDFMFRALEIRRTIYGDNHSLIAMSLNNLGSVYGELGNIKKSLEYHIKALKIEQSILGDNHPSIARSFNNVGLNYSDLGDNQKALEYLLKALEIRRSVLGENHPDTAMSLNNLGVTYGDLGDYQKALECQLKALEIYQSVFGENHPDTAKMFNNIGSSYSDLGNHQKALEYKQKALDIKLSIFGDKHIDTAVSYNNIGRTYSELGDHESALKYRLKALEIYQSVFGENHPDTAKIFNNVGSSYSELGNYQKALEYKQKAMEIRKSLLGENHPDTVDSINTIGKLYANLGDYKNALGFLLRALELRQSIFGDNNPSTAESLNNVGFVYGKLGNTNKFLEYQLKALHIRQSLFGDNHLATIRLLNNIWSTYFEMGEYSLALDYQYKALKSSFAIYGENSEEVAMQLNNIGASYRELGEYPKAIENIQKALDISIAIDNKLGIATYHNRLGKTYQAAKDYQQAISHYQQAADLYSQLGNEEELEENRKAVEDLKKNINN